MFFKSEMRCMLDNLSYAISLINMMIKAILSLQKISQVYKKIIY